MVQWPVASPVNLGIYIQVPFCRTKCTYCNFHTGVFSSSLYSPYVASVCREIAGHRDLYRSAGIEWPVDGERSPVDTLYVGGGTPSLLAPDDLARMVDTARSVFAFRASEVTLEVDPETVTEERAAAWRANGFNRISLGVQSFHDKELSAAGRLHRREDIFAATECLRGVGLGNLSFDLIAGLPYQTQESWTSSVEETAALHPEHISVYMMEIDDGSRLGKEVLGGGHRYSVDSLPIEDDIVAFYEHARGRLETAGYRHYEISNWARPGKESRHNLKYWRREPYLGFGAGAYSFNGTMRWANAHDPRLYVSAIERGVLPLQEREVLSAEQALNEELFLGLRQLEGICVEEIERHYGVRLAGRIRRLEADGLVVRTGESVRLAPERLSVANEIFVELMG